MAKKTIRKRTKKYDGGSETAAVDATPSQETYRDDIGATVLKERDYYERASTKQRDEWEELWKLYIGELGESKHRSLSKNFVPKTHQAVETMASFLVGSNPSIRVSPVGADDDDKAHFMGRLLEFQWTSVLHMKPKVLTWVKSAILFGVGVMKVGWDSETDEPFAYPVNIGDFYIDPLSPTTQDSYSAIERIVLPLETVKERYKVEDIVPSQVISLGDRGNSDIFDIHDLDPVDRGVIDRVELLERWTKDKVCTIAVQQREDSEGKRVKYGRVLREIPNPYGFIPYASVHYKDSPLPNRFYTIGAIEPVKRVHKRINSLVNQIVDNVNLVISPPAIVRRGSGLDPRQLQLFPAKAVLVNDPTRDVIFQPIPDTTATGFRLYQALDMEFQRGTSVTDIRQGISASDTATEARLQQSNLNTTTTLVKENVEYAISVLGDMLVKLNIKYIDSVRSIRIFDPEDIYQFEVRTNKRPQFNGQPLPMGSEERKDIQTNGRVFRVDKGDLDGEFSLQVRADSTLLQNRDVLRKQMIDFVTFLSTIGVQIDVEKLTEQFSELSGIPNAMSLIASTQPPPPAPKQPDLVDHAKVLVALADLAKAGQPITFAQLQQAMVNAGLPGATPNQAANAAAIQQAAEQPQTPADVGPGGGGSMRGPSQSQTSVGISQPAQEQQTKVSPLNG